MIPRAYQLEMARDCLAVIRAHGMAYLAAEERTGKTLAAILVGEMSQVSSVLVVTKKKALEGWEETLSSFSPSKDFTLVNYHQVYKLKECYGLVVLDESHNYISAYPRIGASAAQRKELRKEGKDNKNIYDAVRRVCRNTPVLYMSATPHAQGTQMLFHQFSVCTYGPWRRYDSFYAWFRKYGIPYTVDINGVEMNQYNKCRDADVMSEVEHLFITKTRKELGFSHEPVDVVHYVELSDNTKYWYNLLLKDNIIELSEGTLVCDTTSKLRSALHALEGGTAKIDDLGIVLSNKEKLDYIYNKWGDVEDLVIMYNFKAEKIKLERMFKVAKVLQATSYAEGVDLHKHRHLVIYSQDYSTARHTQRRARQCNLNREEPIHVHHILVKKATSQQIYKTVCVNKKNFVDSVFERNRI